MCSFAWTETTKSILLLLLKILTGVKHILSGHPRETTITMCDRFENKGVLTKLIRRFTFYSSQEQ